MNDFDNVTEERIQVLHDGDVVNTICCTQWFAEHVHPGPGNWVIEPAVQMQAEHDAPIIAAPSLD